MHNRLLLIPGILAAMIIMAFTDKIMPAQLVSGTYGVCDCAEAASEPMNFKLTLQDDHTFQYYRNDGPAHITNVNGKWEMKGNSILLKDYDTTVSIHNKWTFDKNEPCLKSKKGLEWTRLCKVKPCK